MFGFLEYLGCIRSCLTKNDSKSREIKKIDILDNNNKTSYQTMFKLVAFIGVYMHVQCTRRLIVMNSHLHMIVAVPFHNEPEIKVYASQQSVTADSHYH